MILIVDDDPVVQTLFQEILSLEDYRTETAGDGYMAIEKANTMKIDLILLDLMMPGISGLETLERLKDSPLTQRYSGYYRHGCQQS